MPSDDLNPSRPSARRAWNRRQFLAASAAGAAASFASTTSGFAVGADVCRIVDRMVCLPDGRRIGTRRYGDALHGSPVLYFHGAPSARVEPDVIARLAHETGVYLIGIDRPGLGLSSYKSNHQVANYPDDMRALIAALRAERTEGPPIGKVGILSMSSGTPYALACAEQLADDVSAVALVSPRALCAPGVPFGISDDTIMHFMRRPRLADVEMRMIARNLARFPVLGVRRFTRQDSAPDQAFASCHVDWMVRCATESVRCGTAGLYRDLQLQCWPWGVCLEGIRIPVCARHGSCDRTAPAQSLTFLADRVAGGAMREEFRSVAGHGHLTVLANQARELLEWLRDV